MLEKYGHGNMTTYGCHRFKEKCVVLRRDSDWLKDYMKDKKGPYKHTDTPGDTHNMLIDKK